MFEDYDLKSEEEMEETDFYCARCRTTEDIYTLEQKNAHHEVIGVIFVCGQCADSLTGKQMEIRFGTEQMESPADINIEETEEVDLTGRETWN